MSSNAADDGPAGQMGTVEALRRLAAYRDDEAWSAILLTHGPAILRMAQRIGGAALADDAAQETLLQIRAHAAQFSLPSDVRDAEGAARGWVMCIAYRTALGMLRVNQRRSLNDRLAGLHREQAAGSPDEALLTEEQFTLVRSEVAQLPEILRGAVCLHYYGELSYADVSSALACSEDVVRKRVERGVTELRGRLAAAGLAVGVAALTATLAGSGTVAAASTGAVSTIALKQFSAWQALLHSSHAPALAGIVKWGGFAIMGKYIVGTAALIALALSGVQTWRIGALSAEVSALREQAGSSAPLQDKVNALERQLAETRGEAAAFKANLALRNDDFAQIEKTLKGFEKFYGSMLKTPNPGTGVVADLAAVNQELDARKRLADLRKEQDNLQALRAYEAALTTKQRLNEDRAELAKLAALQAEKEAHLERQKALDGAKQDQAQRAAIQAEEVLIAHQKALTAQREDAARLAAENVLRAKEEAAFQTKLAEQKRQVMEMELRQAERAKADAELRAKGFRKNAAVKPPVQPKEDNINDNF